MNLYELTDNYLKVLELIENGEEGLEDTLESINDTIEVKAENYAKIIRNLEGNVNMLKAEVERLNSRKKSIEGNVDRLKENLKMAMIVTGKEKIKTGLFNITVANNPVAVNVIDEKLIPEKYFKVEIIRKLDKISLRDAMKKGEEIQGAELMQGKGLRIK
jgi:predicted SpoU family rRNA methylase